MDEKPWMLSSEDWESGDYVEIAYELLDMPVMKTLRAASHVLFIRLVLHSHAEKSFTLPRKFYKEVGLKKITFDQSMKQLLNRRFIIAKKEKDAYEFTPEVMQYIRKGVPHNASKD